MSRRIAIGMALSLCGCASTPNLTYSYYLGRATSTVTVAETIDCTADKTAIVTLETASVNTVCSADYSQGPYTFAVKRLDGFFADSDATFGFTEDGRLRSVNQTTTGQGERIMRSAISLATAAAALGGAAAHAPSRLPECAFLNSLGGGKPVTISFMKVIDHSIDDNGQKTRLNPVPGNLALYGILKKQLRAKLPVLQIRVSQPAGMRRAIYNNPTESPSGFVPLTVQDTANVTIDVLKDGATFSSSVITVPQPTHYTLPIPKAALFGQQKFSLTLSDSGAITEIQYGKTAGTSGVLNVAAAAARVAAPTSTADKAAELKAEADIIAEQQRLARCRTHPNQCQ